MSYGFVANFIRFATVQIFENQLIFDKVTESLKVGTFLRHGIVVFTLSSPVVPSDCTSKCSRPYWSNPPFLIC